MRKSCRRFFTRTLHPQNIQKNITVFRFTLVWWPMSAIAFLYILFSFFPFSFQSLYIFLFLFFIFPFYFYFILYFHCFIFFYFPFEFFFFFSCLLFRKQKLLYPRKKFGEKVSLRGLAGIFPRVRTIAIL